MNSSIGDNNPIGNVPFNPIDPTSAGPSDIDLHAKGSEMIRSEFKSSESKTAPSTQSYAQSLDMPENKELLKSLDRQVNQAIENTLKHILEK